MPTAAKPTSSSKQRIKSRSGCLKCKKRRVKCDEGAPSCNQCLVKGFECPGYRKPVKWSLKYEVNRPEKGDQFYSWIEKELGAAAVAFGGGEPASASSEPVPSTTKATASETTEKPKRRTREAKTSEPSSEDANSGQEPCINVLPGVTWEGNSESEGDEQDVMAPEQASVQNPMDEMISMMTTGGFDLDLPALDCQMDPITNEETWINESVDPFGSMLMASALASFPPADATSHGLPNHTKTGSFSSTMSGFEMMPPTPVAPVANTQETGLIRYYFSEVVIINSCFQSANDPLRGDLWIMVADSALLYHTVASMAAAHLAKLRGDAKMKAMEHQAEALSHLQKEVSRLRAAGKEAEPDVDMSLSLTPFTPMDKVLISVILIGYSSAWHSASSLGLSHLNGARPLMRSWLASRFHNRGRAPAEAYTERIPSLLLGMMAYWETLVSFMADQDPAVTDYLMPFAGTEAPMHTMIGQGANIIPNPWTGICTPVLILLTKAGNLVRRRRILSRMGLGSSSSCSHSILHSHLRNEAASLELKLRRCATTCIPPAAAVEDTLDSRTPVAHLQAMARVYRLTGLLELYRAFPEVAPVTEKASYGELVFDTAVSMLTILASIPRGSGVRVFQLLPLIAASSALGAAVSDSGANLGLGLGLGLNEVGGSKKAEKPSDGDDGNVVGDLHAELSRITRGPEMVERWRMFVRGRMSSLCSLIGLPPVEQASKLIEEVWRQMDWEATLGEGGGAGRGGGRGVSKVHWVEVMVEHRLESMF